MTEVAPQPIVHTSTDQIACSKVVKALTDPARAREGTGWHVVVQVFEGSSTVFARLNDAAQAWNGDSNSQYDIWETGHGSQRWLKHERRGASPGGWTEAHHPRSEVELGAWRDERAEAIDRDLIRLSKQAWKCDADAPYAVEFAPMPLG